MFRCPYGKLTFGDKEGLKNHIEIAHREKVIEALGKYNVTCPRCKQGGLSADRPCPKCEFDLTELFWQRAVGMIAFLSPTC